MKMFHEAPKSLFKVVKTLTDGDYALAHLLEKDPDYARLFMQRDFSRLLILDNSVSELGHSVPWDVLEKWSVLLKPNWVVLPDKDDDYETTIKQGREYLSRIAPIPRVNYMGVVKGLNYREWSRCYKDWDVLLPPNSMIGFSYDCTSDRDNSYRTMLDRISLLLKLERDGVINKKRRHHLLGCCLPEEVFYYRQPWVYSIDTSKPVTGGMVGQDYRFGYPKERPGIDLMEYMDIDLAPGVIELIRSNIIQMRRWSND